MANKVIIDNGYIIATATTPFGTDENTDEIEQMLRNQPTADDGFVYRLRADTLTWELVESPPMPIDDELTAEEALDIITGGAT